MGVDIMFTVEHRPPGGPWKRAEPLVPNPENGFFDDPLHPTLEQDLPRPLTFYPRDRWPSEKDQANRQPLPDDHCTETREFLTVWCEGISDVATLRDLGKTDWLAACSEHHAEHLGQQLFHVRR